MDTTDHLKLPELFKASKANQISTSELHFTFQIHKNVEKAAEQVLAISDRSFAKLVVIYGRRVRPQLQYGRAHVISRLQ
jgi:hypothetical protein